MAQGTILTSGLLRMGLFPGIAACHYIKSLALLRKPYVFTACPFRTQGGRQDVPLSVCLFGDCPELSANRPHIAPGSCTAIAHRRPGMLQALHA